MDTFDVKLLKRAIGQKKKHTSIKSFYGDKSWARDLDIVNELGGHTGCVNALNWSTSGRLLASGSDDQYLNIWEYNPVNQAKPFTLNTSVQTGHRANIFSVKFMPHSSDRTVVTCAGDSEVRVFDLEYGGGQVGNASESTRSRRINNFFGNARWLTESNTNARVYRSHADRAKRIVTESSPYLFLSCSEDGEVRQWDLRQPSSAYPPPRDGRRFAFRRMAASEMSGDPPPPLISYKRYRLDLNSISCSGSQPQYIALGGAHLHCFLHDRRMLGRDLSAEHGTPDFLTPTAGSNADESMREATRCVRRFAPNNKRRMGARDSGHITACKISDARPNELISSWSGDHIYSFDIVKSPDARDADARADKAFQRTRLRNAADRKRKRAKASTSSLGEGAPSGQRLRRVADDQQEEGLTALRVRYENGETEDIPLGQNEDGSDTAARAAHDNLLSEAQKQSERIARALVQLRKTLFDFSSALENGEAAAMEGSSELTSHTSSFTDVLGQASVLLPEISEIMRTWPYPMDPDEEEVTFQNTLRRNRQTTWRFVQAAGCLSRVLGGKLQTSSSAPHPQRDQFDFIRPATHEGRSIDNKARFCYDFLKAIVLWLEGGKEAVLAGFQKPVSLRIDTQRFPLDSDDTIATVPEKLKEYLLEIASEDRPVIDLGTNRFERDELRQVFEDQKAAVQAFTRALEHIELRSHHGTSEIVHLSSGGTTKRVMDRGAAARFWGVKVGRALLMEAAEGVNFGFVNRAFGGLRVHVVSELDEFERSDETIDQDDDEPVVDAIDLVTTTHESVTTETARYTSDQDTDMVEPPSVTIEDVDEDGEQSILIDAEEVDEDEDDDNVQDSSDNDDDDSSSDTEGEHERHLYRRRVGFGRLSTDRAQVNSDVAYTSHTKVYRGHCNTRTVKDVNYYGLDDEYVVSGSDDGHFFIWDRKTGVIVNILEGDGEVVNVVQGHPYEPMIACSGIDSTVKIFGPGGDNRERYKASRGVDIANPGGARHSSLGFGARVRRARRAAGNGDGDSSDSGEDTQPQTDTATAQTEETAEELASRKGLKSRRAINREYEITAQNDTQRRQGAGDAFVTQGMLARFAAALQRGEIQGVVGEGFGAEGGTVILDDNCNIM